MSIGSSFFNAIDASLKLLDSKAFKDLYFIEKYNPSRQDSIQAYQVQSTVFDLRKDLEALLREYHDMIYDFDNLLKEEDVSKNLKQLKDLHLRIEIFLDNVRKIMEKIEKADLPSRVKNSLNETFNEPKQAAHKALRDYYNSCSKIYNTLNLPQTLSRLEEDFKHFQTSQQKLSKTEKKNKNPISAYQLHKNQDPTKIDIEKFEQAYPKLKEDETKKKDTYFQKEKKYDRKLLVGLLGFLVVTLPVVIPLFIYYAHKSTNYNKNKRIHEKRLFNLEQVKKDIDSIKQTSIDLNKNQDASKINEEFIQEIIAPKVTDLKEAVNVLGKKLEIDLQERSKHSFGARFPR
ncbi:MAG: hypothetical protein JSS07_00960 [Proteobacteria bacterium]|nr:hypothetical protein [Pseudomonadota bacterium]